MKPQVIERMRDLIEQRDHVGNLDNLDNFDTWLDLNDELAQILTDNAHEVLAALERTQEDE